MNKEKNHKIVAYKIQVNNLNSTIASYAALHSNALFYILTYESCAKLITVYPLYRHHLYKQFGALE